MNTAPRHLPLSGIRVLDFGHTVMGPTAGLVFADLGAEVIRVEPASGDPTRRLRGFGTGYFPFYNRNKKSLAVDLKSQAGKEVVNKLLAKADVLLENFGPGTIERLGFGYETVHTAHPHLIYLSMKGFLPGPYEKRLALDEVVQMMSGLAYMTGPPGQPLRAGASVVDVLGGIFGAMGVLVALRERETTGQGTLVRSSLFESVMFLMGQHLAYAALSEEPVPPMPARVSAWAIYDQFPTSDGETVFVGITSDKQWQAFCDEFNRPDLLADESLATNNQRISAKERLRPLVGEIVSDLPLLEIEERCVRAKLPFAHVARPEQLFDDPHLNAGGRLLETRLEGNVVTRLPALPFEIGAFKAALYRDPPEVGADTCALLEELGYGKKEMKALIESGAVVSTDNEAQSSTAVK